MHTRPVALAALALTTATLALTTTACGTSNSTTSGAATTSGTTTSAATTTSTAATSASSVLPAAFSQAAEAICAKRNKAVAAAGLTVESEAAFQRVAHDRAIVEQQTLTELQKLTPPPAAHAEWTQFLKDRQGLIKAWEQLAKHGLINKHAKGTAEYRINPVSEAQNKMLNTAKHQNLTQCTQQN